MDSKLVKDFMQMPFEEVLDKMDLYTGPRERRMLKNVAAMMFCENPKITIPSMIVKSGKSRTTIQKCIKKLKEEKRIERLGGKNGGIWKILK